jgi:hypothetical protein
MSEEQEHEAVRLLALVLHHSRTETRGLRSGVRSASALDGALHSATHRRRMRRDRRRGGRSGHQAKADEANRFMTDLIAATLPRPSIGVVEWWGSGMLSGHLGVPLVPDAGFRFLTPAGAIDCLLEWDRGTEPGSVLERKLRLYRKAAGRTEDCSILFVVPSTRRARTVHAAKERAVAATPSWSCEWPLLVATVPELEEFGHLGRVWQRLGESTAPIALAALPARQIEPAPDPADALGRRWRKDRADFWHCLSPLGVPAPDEEEWR